MRIAKGRADAPSQKRDDTFTGTVWAENAYEIGIRSTISERSRSETTSTCLRFQRSTHAPVNGASSRVGNSMTFASADSSHGERASLNWWVCSASRAISRRSTGPYPSGALPCACSSQTVTAAIAALAASSGKRRGPQARHDRGTRHHASSAIAAGSVQSTVLLSSVAVPNRSERSHARERPVSRNSIHASNVSP